MCNTSTGRPKSSPKGLIFPASHSLPARHHVYHQHYIMLQLSSYPVYYQDLLVADKFPALIHRHLHHHCHHTFFVIMNLTKEFSKKFLFTPSYNNWTNADSIAVFSTLTLYTSEMTHIYRHNCLLGIYCYPSCMWCEQCSLSI